MNMNMNPSSASAVAITDPYSHQDPLPPNLREGDHFLLHFADNRQIFAQALPKWKCVKGYSPCKINKRTYGTQNLIGLPYGTVMEVGRDGLIPLVEGEDLLPGAPEGVIDAINRQDGDGNNSINAIGAAKDATKIDGNAKYDDDVANGDKNANVSRNDNRNLVDDNTSQKLTHEAVHGLMADESTPGSHIVAALISNSATFESKTAFSQAKYVKRKQLKYQPRCRIVRVTPATLCSAMHLKDSRKISNLREDTLGQILSNANVCAGQRVMVMDTAVQGIVTAGCTRRMGGYGTVISLYAGQQPSYLDMVVNRMNFSIGEKQCLKWVSLGEVFGDPDEKERQTKSLCNDNGEVLDVEKRDRESISWPAQLQQHTRTFLLNELKNERKISQFVMKRASRFTRKLTRHTVLELRSLVDGCNGDAEERQYNMTAMDGNDPTDGGPLSDNHVRQCDSLIIATKYDPTVTLLRLLPYLTPSCPFVVYHEFLEPLLETFRTLQNYYVPGDGDVANNNDDDAATNDDKERTKSTPMMLRRNVAINLRLTDSWFREYQVLEGRTHPNMTMSQNGGYLLTGTKLCPRTGTKELDDEEMKEIRLRLGGRRKRQRGGGDGGRKKRKNGDGGGEKKGGGKKCNKK
eukprot:CAMPEP_0172553612 /NCGR_PEP_ID=MMETSP1067-20121228/51302_1 /TAXON_ID=265564 ORGANISM="Thalassiosira punctigera, Strain Tpunct2005C2" /NCGR_SAMPLE_ID=MMETSP1067 /ASSEMBLY_ACC=CAM_ASM_000444 /LENGTH=631 /DNA_ID=CAMNT_0013341827 /DNA_START=19 /DNA_END=1914 /DNA_ORIENTATION=+